MPQPIYLPRQPTFMEQFLGTGVMDNIMSSIMMGVQNRRADDATARGYLDKGYTEVQPVPESQQAAAPQTPEEQAAFESGPRGAYWKQHAPADVTVGTGRGAGPFHSPKRGFRKPVEKEVLKPGKPFEMKIGNTHRRVTPMRDQYGNLKGFQNLGESFYKGTSGFKDIYRTFEKKNPKTGKMETWRQDYDIEQKTRKRIKVGDPYRTKVGGDTTVTTNLKMSSPTERENLAKGETTLGQLNELKNLHEAGYVGKWGGTKGKVKDFFGRNPQKQSEFYALTASFNNRLINLITGAAMGEAEAKRIMSEAPSIYDEPSVWQAKWKQSERNVRMLQKERAKIMRGSGIGVPKLTSEESKNLSWELMQDPSKGMESYNKLMKSKKDDPFGFD